MKKLNATQIKYLLAALMVLDHLPHVPGLVPPLWEGIFHAMTRCVAAGFAYLAVEGFLHTRNLQRYQVRLWGAAAIMAAGNWLLNSLLANRGVHISNNIFLTLALGVSILALAFPGQSLTQEAKGLRWAGAGLLFLVGLLLTEGGMVVLPFILITYCCRQRQALGTLLYLGLALILFTLSYTSYDSWQETLTMMLYNSDWLFISVLPLLALYNGQRGKQSAFNRYFFYVFYPLHLWLLALVAAGLAK